MKDLYSAFGALLRMHRIRAGLTQDQLGRLIGLGRTAVTNIENGNQGVALHQVYEFAKALRIGAEQLLPQLEPRPISNKTDTVGSLVIDKADQQVLRTIRKERTHVKDR